jgi:hypothetical protein
MIDAPQQQSVIRALLGNRVVQVLAIIAALVGIADGIIIFYNNVQDARSKTAAADAATSLAPGRPADIITPSTITTATHAPVTVKGVNTCADWITGQKKQWWREGISHEESQRMEIWILGYLSGRAAASGVDFLRGRDPYAIFNEVTRRCALTPSVSGGTADISFDISEEFIRQALKKP